jgi:hypothetical protein
MKRPGIAEILLSVSNRPVGERQTALAHHAPNMSLVMLLKYMFDPNVKFLLPEGTPPFKKNEFLDQTGNLYSEFRRMYLFIEGGNPNLTNNKREMLFVQLLEMLDKDDAALVVAMKDKVSPYPGITYELVHKTFPGLLPEPDTKSTVKKLKA